MPDTPEEVLDAIRSGMRLIKPPKHHDKVYREECMFSFDTPESPGGLYVNLYTYQGFGADYVDLDHSKTGNTLYLHCQHTRVPLPPDEGEGAGPTRLAIGGDGGFKVDQPGYTVSTAHALVVLPARVRVALPAPDLPELVLSTVEAILKHESVSTQDKVAAWEEERPVSKYAATLEQLPPSRKISPNPADWRCEETGVAENLWLNLSTGVIGSGRPNWDGSGGNGAALRHYEATGRRYPLVVKLGTITPSGADVYSYAPDEDDMVTDPLLREHLAHWGINMLQMEKTEKTMAELQIDLNMSFEFDRITEAGGHLQPLAGPGLVGLENLGNSCYMNSCLQLLFAVPLVAQRYASHADALFASAPPDPAGDLPTQMAKLGLALATGRTGAPPPLPPASAPTAAAEVAAEGAEAMEVEAPAAANGADTAAPPPLRLAVRPASFKALVGRGHQEFSSARQQDAAEFWRHLLELLQRSEHAQGARLAAAAGDASAPLAPTGSVFDFRVENRTQCGSTGAVSYKSSVEGMLALSIPVEAATNAGQVAAYQARCAKRQRLTAMQATAYISAEPNGADAAAASVDVGTGAAAGGGGGGVVDGAVAPQAEVLEAGGQEAPVLPRVPLAACLTRFAAEEELGDYFSAAAGAKVTARRTSRLATFPRYLLVQMKRYYVAEDWTPRKLEVEVDVPETLDLSGLRASGPQEGEVLQPEDAQDAGPAAAAATRQQQPQPPPPAQPDPLIVAQLVSMGFGENGSKRAALAVGNSSAEAAMEWVFGHMEEPGFNDPLAPAAAVAEAAAEAPAAAAGGGAAAPGAGVDAEGVATLAAMGFSERQAAAALQATGGHLERAGDWLFSHMDDLDAAVAGVEGAAAANAAAPASASAGRAAGPPPLDDGPGRYRLAGLLSHMGSNTACGHYVAHVRKGGRWVIFNDDKVAASEHPPFSLGYIYLFEREDQSGGSF